MKTPPARLPLCAVVFAAFSFVVLPVHSAPADEPLYYIYHGRQKALTLDAEHVAVRVTPTVPSAQSAAALPMSLISRGLTEADIVARPVAGWMIVSAPNVSGAASSANQLVSPADAAQSDAAALHTTINSMLNSGDPSIEFVSPVFRDDDGAPIIVTPTILIGFEPRLTAKGRANLRAAVSEGAQAQKIEFPQPNDERWQIQSRDGFAVLNRTNVLATSPGVAYAEPDMIVTGHANLVPTDPGFGDSWGLSNTGQSGGQVGFDMKATAAWDITTGSSSVIVLVIDVGVQQDHPDINQVTGKDFTTDAAVNPNGGPFGQYDNHGTWVAGCISERINNGLGTAGIAPGVKVASARCYNNGQANGTFSFQFSWVVDGLNWGQSIGARVSNNSNGYGSTSSAIESAYASTRAAGMVHFAAAGNSGAASISYPASIAGVNAVGATNRFGQRSSFSQYGTGLKFMAPGEEIVTTDRTGAASVAGDYAVVSGTSFASPYAAGIAALIVSQNSSLTADQIENVMQSACFDMGPAGYDTGYGYGMLSAYLAVKPRITSSLNPPSGPVGSSFSYQITANNSPTSFSATGLPAGLNVNATTGLISGTPTPSGTFQVDVTAYGSIGNATATVQIVITGPTITSSLSNQTVDSGAAFTYQITATNSPTSYDATDLPPGLQIDNTTGLVTGTPNVPGTYQVTVIAHTALGDATAFLQIVIRAPQITAGTFFFMYVGDDYTKQVTASKPGNSFEATGLPPGLQIDTLTGVISGNATQTGDFGVTLIAHTDFGDGSAAVLFRVSPPAIISFGPGPMEIGLPYTYQITASSKPTSYTVVGLPAGLTLDPLTGLIAGVPTLSGTYVITITAHTPFGDVSRNDQITLWPVSDPPLATYAVTASAFVSDPQRGIVFVLGTDANGPAVFVFDPSTMTLSRSFALSKSTYYNDMAFSADRMKLWVMGLGLGMIDLNSNTVVPDLPLADTGFRLRADVNDHLYISLPRGGIARIDSATGATQMKFALQHGAAYDGYSNYIEMSPDQKTLYIGDTLDSPLALESYDVSGASPLLVQSVVQNNNLVGAAIVSHDNQWIYQGRGNLNQPGGVFEKFAASDVGTPVRLYPIGGASSLSPDDSTMFLAQSKSRVQMLDLATDAVTRTLVLPKQNAPATIIDDPTDSYLLVRASQGFTSEGILYVYPAHPPVTGPPPPSPAHSFLNVSTRTFVLTGDKVEIGGFIIQGDQPKKVVLRAVGPSLAAAGLPAVTDPVLELHDSTGAIVATNDNWNSHRQDVLATGLVPTDEHEAVIVTTLTPGSYTVVLKGLDGATGTALFDLYDVDPTNSRVANISTRANVGIGDNVMIGGFIVGGDQPTNVIIRAIGPSLTQAGVAGALQNPVLELHDGSGNLIVQNDEWRSSQEQAIIDSGFAPSSDHESVIMATLQPGNYTAIVRGKSNSTGVALVEVYNLEPN